jgi:hypothetical protein
MSSRFSSVLCSYSLVALLGCGDNLAARPDASPGMPGMPDAPGAPGPEQTVTSPDGAIAVTVRVIDGRPTYAITRAGAPVLATSGLGLRFQDAPSFEDGLEVASVERRSVNQTWQPVWGDASEIRERYEELVVHLRRSADGGRLDVIVRAFDDGVGLRYAVPAQDGLEQVALTEELTEMRFAGDGKAWWTPADFEGDESLYREDALSALEDANTPMTVQLDDALYVAVHEADLDDYAAMTLAAVAREPGSEPGAPPALRSALVPARSDEGNEAVKAELTVPFETPWRTFTIGATAGALIESHLILNLNDPCAICDGDTSWIRPSKYMGVWWEIHKGISTWAPGPNVAATTDNTKRYIDFAAAHDIPYVLAEGWNTGWEGDWGDMDFTQSHAGFDLDEVVSYGAARGVGFMAHLETGANVAGFEAQIDEAFALYESLGISAIKTGYVGTVAGHHHYSQRMVNHYAEVVQKAAEHGIMVNAHEPIKPTGEHRTYPNFMSREGLRGMEYNAWSAGNPPSHELVLPFTRMLGGPVDYNPGIFDVLWAPERVSDSPFFGTAPTRVHSTRARQLALYVILLSGVQMVTDVPENYEGQPELAFIEDVPVTWDETRVIHGEIGRYITVARRSGDEWYLGSATDETPRVLEIPLDFLPGDTFYVAETYTDAADADFEDAPNRVYMRSVLVTAADTLVATMEAGGGQAVRLRPATAADMSALPRYVEPALDVVDVTVPEQVVVDDFVMISADIGNSGTLVGGEAVRLRVGEQEVTSPLVRVGAGENTRVDFEIQPGVVGEVDVVVGDAAPVRITVVGRDGTPAAPAGLRVTDVSGSAIGLAWDAVLGATGYRIFRHRPGDIYGLVPHAEVAAGTTTFTDRDDVTLGSRYFYIVRAVHDGNVLSPASNQVEATATARLVAVTFRVRVPDETPPTSLVFVPGNIDALGPWNPGLVDMTSQGNGIWEVTIDVPEQTSVQYKYTRGNWETVEWWGAISGLTNRAVVVGSEPTMLVDNTSRDFGDGTVPDIAKAVQLWRDPLVAATVPAAGATVGAPATIEITFSRDVTAPDAGYGGTVQVRRGDAVVDGSVAEPVPGRLVFTPAAALVSGAYDVRVSDVRSALGGDSVPMQAAYTFSFTVP